MRRILVHSAGRTGSSSIVSALMSTALEDTQCLHTHVLSRDTLDWIYEENDLKHFMSRPDLADSIHWNNPAPDVDTSVVIVTFRSRFLRNTSDFLFSKLGISGTWPDTNFQALIEDFWTDYPHDYPDSWLEKEFYELFHLTQEVPDIVGTGIGLFWSDALPVLVVLTPNGFSSLEQFLSASFGKRFRTIGRRNASPTQISRFRDMINEKTYSEFIQLEYGSQLPWETLLSALQREV